jgi:hypothetical protein
MTEFLVGAYVLGLTVCIANIIRLHYYGQFMLAQVERVFEARVAGDLSVTYPAINPSYDNFKWYDIFNYKFDSLVVYEKGEK